MGFCWFPNSPPNSGKLVWSIIYIDGPVETKKCEIALKYALKLIFLKYIIEFMINTAPPASNSFYGREKWFWYNKINFLTKWHCGAVVKSCLHVQMNRVRLQATLFSVSLYGFFFCLVFVFYSYFSFWPVFLYSYCWPFIALRGFCYTVFLVWLGFLCHRLLIAL